jgi:hypothetical protein
MADTLTLIAAATTSALQDDLRDIVTHVVYDSRAFRPDKVDEAITSLTAQLEATVARMTAAGYVLVPTDVRLDLETCALACRFTLAIRGAT